jgi:octaprenyl-diphosphate synthase
LIGKPVSHLHKGAALVELLHTGTLLHDDVMDRARVRRNRPTVNRLWGESVAVLAGDYLLTSVMDLALRTGHPDIPELAIHTMMEMVSGQMLEIRHHGNLSLREADYMQIIRKKTASLFDTACRLGATLSGGTPEEIRSLGNFGREAGTAFQLMDDLLDYTGKQAHTGKEPGRDLAEGKVTLPVIVAFRKAGSNQRREIRQIFSDPRRLGSLGDLSALVRDLGGFAHTRLRARECVEKASLSLKVFPACTTKSVLEQTAGSMVP